MRKKGKFLKKRTRIYSKNLKSKHSFITGGDAWFLFGKTIGHVFYRTIFFLAANIQNISIKSPNSCKFLGCNRQILINFSVFYGNFS